MIGRFGKDVLMILAVFLAKHVLPKLATKTSSSILDKFERKISGQRAARAGKGLTLFFPNKDMNDIIRIVKSIAFLIDGTTETLKHEIKKQ